LLLLWKCKSTFRVFTTRIDGQQFKKNDRLVFVVCGSASSWIEENLLGSTGFVGRISYTLTLEEVPLPDCNRFWPDNIAAYEKFKILSVNGRSTEIPRGNRSETRRRSATASFTKTSSNYWVAGAKEMSVIKSLLTGDQHGHTLALEHNVASRIDGDVCWFGEDQRFSL
jgi:hypothetical protein